MSTETKNNKKISYPIFKMKEKGTLILTPEVVNQIMYLHSAIGSTEWSAVLLYDVISGSPSDPKSFVLKAKHIYLMDIGTASYTEYDFDGDIVDMYAGVEGAMQMKIGHIHSHHTMSAFFSGTDNDELMTNVDKYNYYLSLIVNFSGNYACKVAFLSEVKNTSWMYYTNDQGKLMKFKTETAEKNMVTIDMNIVLEYDNQFFYSRLQQVKDKIENAKKAEKKAKALSEKSQMKIPYSEYYQKPYTGYKQADPNFMTNSEVECLTKNMLAISPKLEETRSTLQILFDIVKSTDEEIELFYQYFAMNIETVISGFFDDRVLLMDELKVVIEEVAMNINIFAESPKVGDLVTEIIGILEEFIETVIEDTTDDELEAEIKEISNGIEKDRR